MESQSYQPSWLAEFLHSFPHLDLTFQQVNSSFSPYKAVYRESLVFWAAIPLLWLVLTLIVFLVYFCYRCCQRDVEKKQKVPCLKWSMAVLAMVTIGGVGMGFYGNEVGHRGVAEFVEACNDGNLMLERMKEQSFKLESSIENNVKVGINGLQGLYPRGDRVKFRAFTSETDNAYHLARDIFDEMTVINHRSENINLGDVPELIAEYEFYRWLGMCLLLLWMVILCLLLLLGIGLTSKCSLLMFCAFGIFTLVLSWLTAGLHLGISVGMGDFCVAPGNFFQRLGYQDVEKDVLRYYFECNDSVENPFRSALLEASDKVTAANASLNIALSDADEIMENTDVLMTNANNVYLGFDEMRYALLELSASVQCSGLHKHYMDGVEGLCYTTLPGIGLLLLSATISGLLFTVLVVLASRAWRHFGSKKAYMEVEDDDPFLPRPDNSSPSYYSFSRSGGRAGRGPDGNKSLGRRSTPPPAVSNSPTHCQYCLQQGGGDAAVLTTSGSEEGLDDEVHNMATMHLPPPSAPPPYHKTFLSAPGQDTGMNMHEPILVNINEQGTDTNGPPPGYNSNEFYRQYGDVNHSDDMNPDYMQVRESHA